MLQLQVTNGEPAVTAYGRLPISVGVPVSSKVVFGEKDLTAALRELLQELEPQTNEVIVTLSNDKVYTRQVLLPVMRRRELKAAMHCEIEKSISLPVAELTIRYLNLDVLELADGKFFHLLSAAAPTALLYDYYGFFARAGLQIVAIDLQVLGLWRLFSGFSSVASLKSTVGVLDIGTDGTQFIVIKEGKLQWSAFLPVGANQLSGMDIESYGNSISEKLYTEIRQALARRAAVLEGTTPIKRLILSGSVNKMEDRREDFMTALEVPVDFIYPNLSGLPGDEPAVPRFDSSFAVVLGTVLREVVK